MARQQQAPPAHAHHNGGSHSARGDGAIWKWAFTTLLAVTIGIGSYALTKADGRLSALEDARVPHAAAEATLRGEVANLSRQVQELGYAVRELNRKLEQRQSGIIRPE